jgi:hypothetical protein
MPEISRLRHRRPNVANEHATALHATYGDYEISVTIEDGMVIDASRARIAAGARVA